MRASLLNRCNIHSQDTQMRRYFSNRSINFKIIRKTKIKIKKSLNKMTYSSGMDKLERQESQISSTAPNNDDTKIWSDILQEVQNSTKKTPPPKSVILLGDNESGRSTLISRMKGVETISKGIGLEYHYLDVNNEEDRDDTQKLGVWMPDGDGSCTGQLLNIALNESNFENTIVAFVVSMSTPWSIMSSLNKWSKILTDHINKLKIPDQKRNDYFKQQCRIFQTYQDPDDKQPIQQSQSEQIENDDDLLPLDPAILSKNLGISIIVIVTKSDSISILDKENEYRIEHFDFIQYHVRRFCLDYGASLFYTTIKDKRTYDKLFKYIQHKLYGYSFNMPSSVVDRECIFIPSGWDNEGKINILLENSTTLKSDSEYSDVISKPSIRKPTTRDIETVIAIEDQDFLSKLQLVLNKTSAPSNKQVNQPEIQILKVFVFKFFVFCLNKEEISPAMNAASSSVPSLKNTKSQVGKNAGSGAPDSTNLKNFFQNLLNKNAPTTPTSINQDVAGSAGAAQVKQEPKNETNA